MASRTTMQMKQYLLAAALTAGFVTTSSVVAQPMTRDQGQGQSHQGHHGNQGHQEHHRQDKSGRELPAANARTLPPMPVNLPAWMENKNTNHIYRKRGSYNDDIYNVRSLARDLNAVAVGHAMAYQDLVTGRADRLETDTFNRINWVLNNPPRFMPDEANISSTFGRKYGVLEQVFDWTHILHAQTVDVLASTELTDAEKDAEIERLYRFYAESVPYAITPLPMNMGYLDSQPYSQAFRRQYPKVNGLFWGYHWLQGTMYDTLYGKTLPEQRAAYARVGKRYHEVELYRTDRPFMPMFAEVSPKFAKKYPQISNTFDNLHMLHDMVNDILASDWMSEAQKEGQIKRAMWMVSADAHKGMEPGDFKPGNLMHDHRFMPDMPGMGMMPEGLMNYHGMHHGEMPMNRTQEATEQRTTNHRPMQHDTRQPGKKTKDGTAPNADTAPAGNHMDH